MNKVLKRFNRKHKVMINNFKINITGELLIRDSFLILETKCGNQYHIGTILDDGTLVDAYTHVIVIRKRRGGKLLDSDDLIVTTLDKILKDKLL